MQQSQQTPKYEKHIGERLNELMDAMTLIGDCIKGIKQNKPYYFLPLYAQMRALLISGRNNQPLLISLAKELKIELNVFHKRAVTLPPSLPEPVMLFDDPSFMCSIERRNPAQQMSNLEQFLKLDVIVLEARKFSLEHLIKVLAEKFGGAHYDPRVTPEEYQLTNFVGNLTKQALLGLAELIFQLGLRVVRQFSAFSVYMACNVPKQKLEGTYSLFSFTYPGTAIHFSAYLHSDMMLQFEVIDLRQDVARVSANRRLKFDSQYALGFSYRIDDQMRSELSIAVDGSIVASKLHFPPLTARNDLHFYEQKYNTVPEGKDYPTLTLKLGRLLVYSTEHSSEERAQIAEGMLSEEGYLLLHPGCEAICAPGQTELKLTGRNEKVAR